MKQILQINVINIAKHHLAITFNMQSCIIKTRISLREKKAHSHISWIIICMFNSLAPFKEWSKLSRLKEEDAGVKLMFDYLCHKSTAANKCWCCKSIPRWWVINLLFARTLVPLSGVWQAQVYKTKKTSTEIQQDFRCHLFCCVIFRSEYTQRYIYC